ncbi:MAG: hypothetical protein HOJ15_00150 [Candidatus Jacksonbacteria bacterium]|jgi:hypothetical protein|nr:hypothetical protein [Candidatus Jacksonbacteria bacterium]MBT6034192.1 hypothetical protein [Candidatus Jacksonbacteria bacterium]MBT6300826.1 hypothetical protein [Candidatus Jacksonbacteria bacterium]MBT6757097.1 hypothetical protein [Candidatus Jacksonbacteria bacterium]MBT6955652.1 hypothetical protein [Candidatus Jacksonbacteria bacterium]
MHRKLIEENRPLWGWIIVTIGIVFLLQALGIVPSSIWSYVWPILVIIAGVQIIRKK